jgi:hypothetical protein
VGGDDLLMAWILIVAVCVVMLCAGTAARRAGAKVREQGGAPRGPRRNDGGWVEFNGRQKALYVFGCVALVAASIWRVVVAMH